MNKEQLTNEAIARMKLVGLPNDLIQHFTQTNKLYFSFHGINTILSPVFVPVVKEFEESYSSLVYYAIYNETTLGNMLTLFYVSLHQQEWALDRADLKEGLQLVYVHNFSQPDFSEFGTIAFQKINNSLIRIA